MTSIADMAKGKQTMTEYIVQIEDSEKNMSERFVGQLRSYPELIRCKDCIHYDKPHVENNGTRIEYDDLPEEAFENCIGRLVNSSYGINVGGRCCRDYNVGYSEDKRVFVPETNYCGRAERKTDNG